MRKQIIQKTFSIVSSSSTPGESNSLPPRKSFIPKCSHFQLLKHCPFLSIRCFLLTCAPENPRFCPVARTSPSLCEENQIFPHNHQSSFELVISLLHPHTIADQSGQLCPAPSFHLAPWWSLLLYLCKEEQLAPGHQSAVQPLMSRVGTVHWEAGAEVARKHTLSHRSWLQPSCVEIPEEEPPQPAVHFHFSFPVPWRVVMGIPPLPWRCM